MTLSADQMTTAEAQAAWPILSKVPLPVHVRGQGPGIVLLHELTGATRDCVTLGNRLVSAGFTVFIPRLFGPFGHAPGIAEAITTIVEHVCLNREFQLFAATPTQPSAYTAQVQQVCRLAAEYVAAQRPDGTPRPIGVIGMCLTGRFALVTLLSPDVTAAAVCQPSIPFALPLISSGQQKRALGLTRKEWTAVQSRVNAAPGTVGVFCARYRQDFLSPRERVLRIKRHIASTELVEVAGRKHPTLTVHFAPQIYQDLLKFLRRYVH